MMRKIFIIAAAMSLAGCVTFDPLSNGSIRNLGHGSYTITEMGVFAGNLYESAARHCSSLNQRIVSQGSTTQRGIASGNQYSVLMYRCED